MSAVRPAREANFELSILKDSISTSRVFESKKRNDPKSGTRVRRSAFALSSTEFNLAPAPRFKPSFLLPGHHRQGSPRPAASFANSPSLRPNSCAEGTFPSCPPPPHCCRPILRVLSLLFLRRKKVSTTPARARELPSTELRSRLAFSLVVRIHVPRSLCRSCIALRFQCRS